MILAAPMASRRTRREDTGKILAKRCLSVTFCLPDDADEPIIDVDILQAKSRPLPDPILLRRGNIQYILYAFNNMSLNMI